MAKPQAVLRTTNTKWLVKNTAEQDFWCAHTNVLKLRISWRSVHRIQANRFV